MAGTGLSPVLFILSVNFSAELVLKLARARQNPTLLEVASLLRATIGLFIIILNVFREENIGLYLDNYTFLLLLMNDEQKAQKNADENGVLCSFCRHVIAGLRSPKITFFVFLLLFFAVF